MLLNLEKISKSFNIPGSDRVITVLNDLDLMLEGGKTTAIFGPSGSGKSTLLNIISALDRPTSGKINFNNSDLTTYDDNALSDFRNKQIGIVFQQHHLLPQLNLLENILLPTLPDVSRASIEAKRERAMKLLNRVGLTERIFHYPSELSGGEKQRCAVVRALINTPSLLLADEPTGSLDQNAAVGLIDLLLELNSEEQVAMIFVTHDEPLMKSVSDKYRLISGELVKL
ncbi:MAG: ABC transporter ATP-binding protein [Candidatus Marinimicrobia bacterium]|nr:ABC transporter ATP-binding protein [Candidatus Neomarinimicrobiota bacterium]